MNTIRIRCHQNDFTTDISVEEWEAHDALFQAGWDVLTEGYEPAQAGVVEPQAGNVEAQPEPKQPVFVEGEGF